MTWGFPKIKSHSTPTVNKAMECYCDKVMFDASPPVSKEGESIPEANYYCGTFAMTMVHVTL